MHHGYYDGTSEYSAKVAIDHVSAQIKLIDKVAEWSGFDGGNQASCWMLVAESVVRRDAYMTRLEVSSWV